MRKEVTVIHLNGAETTVNKGPNYTERTDSVTGREFFLITLGRVGVYKVPPAVDIVTIWSAAAKTQASTKNASCPVCGASTKPAAAAHAVASAASSTVSARRIMA